ncbi:MAG: SusE domain-containing protein [Haliscomenobacter sp.]|nr:SusE domain-containing protein [Haliscomenobacter sp.]MBK9491814.1 SusE domain-containing protein [Haliscomenobacter sp.]
MKNWFSKIFPVILIMAILSCEKDEERLVVMPGAAPVLTASTATPVLKIEDASKEAVKFSWSAADFNYPAGVTYTLQLAKKGTDFKEPIEFNAGAALSKSYSVADLNTALLRLGIAPNSLGQLDVRVKAAVSALVPTLASASASLSATPYLVIIEYPSLYVPGGYQGWAPERAAKLASVKDNKIYEGYVYFGDASEFKMTDAPNWNNGIFGDEGDGSSKKIATPGNNFKVASAGYYLLKADLNDKSWDAIKTSWGLIGSGTPGGWDSDTDLTYDAATGTWSVTLDLKADEIKFRANDDWGINFGDTKADGLLDYGGDNIKVAVAGNYTVTLNLSVGGNYSYTLKKN